MKDFFARFFTAILSMLGIASCSSSSSPDDLEVMYGCPTVDYEIKGSVSNQDGEAVTNAMVVPKVDIDGDWIVVDTLYTDSKGAYTSWHQYYNKDLGKTIKVNKVSTIAAENRQFKLVCTPPFDSELQSDSVIVTVHLTGESGWFQGSGESIVDFTLKKD